MKGQLKDSSSFDKILFLQKRKHVSDNLDWHNWVVVQLSLLSNLGSQFFSKKERENTNTRVCAVSFYQTETPWLSFKKVTIGLAVSRKNGTKFYPLGVKNGQI